MDEEMLMENVKFDHSLISRFFTQRRQQTTDSIFIMFEISSHKSKY